MIKASDATGLLVVLSLLSLLSALLGYTRFLENKGKISFARRRDKERTYGGEKFRVDVGEDSSLGDDDLAEQSVELLVVSDRELQVSRDNSRLLVVPGGISSELENLSGEVPALVGD